MNYKVIRKEKKMKMEVSVKGECNSGLGGKEVS
jgi:hypothetical protein